MLINDQVTNLVDELVTSKAFSRFDAAVAVRDVAQSIIAVEQETHAKKLREEVDKLNAQLTEKQAKLKDMSKLIGRPPDKLKRKPRASRKPKEQATGGASSSGTGLPNGAEIGEVRS